MIANCLFIYPGGEYVKHKLRVFHSLKNAKITPECCLVLICFEIFQASTVLEMLNLVFLMFKTPAWQPWELWVS